MYINVSIDYNYNYLIIIAIIYYLCEEEPTRTGCSYFQPIYLFAWDFIFTSGKYFIKFCLFWESSGNVGFLKFIYLLICTLVFAMFSKLVFRQVWLISDKLHWNVRFRSSRLQANCPLRYSGFNYCWVHSNEMIILVRIKVTHTHTQTNTLASACACA